MKSLPTDPFEFQARVMDALCADIRDLNTRTFPRLNALREVSIQSTREAGSAQEAPARDQ